MGIAGRTIAKAGNGGTINILNRIDRSDAFWINPTSIPLHGYHFAKEGKTPENLFIYRRIFPWANISFRAQTKLTERYSPQNGLSIHLVSNLLFPFLCQGMHSSGTIHFACCVFSCDNAQLQRNHFAGPLATAKTGCQLPTPIWEFTPLDSEFTIPPKAHP